MSFHPSLLVLITFNSRLILLSPINNGICQTPLCYNTFIIDQIIYSYCLLVFRTFQKLNKNEVSCLTLKRKSILYYRKRYEPTLLLWEWIVILMPFFCIYALKIGSGTWGTRTPNFTVTVWYVANYTTNPNWRIN